MVTHGHQFIMRSLFYNNSLVNDSNMMSAANSRKAVSNHYSRETLSIQLILSRQHKMSKRVLTCITLSRACCTTSSLSVSNALVASSNRSMDGRLIIARAIAIRCFCPPLNCAPYHIVSGKWVSLLQTFFANLGAIAVWKLCYKIMRICTLGRGFNIFNRGVFYGLADVFGNRSRKQHWFLSCDNLRNVFNNKRNGIPTIPITLRNHWMLNSRKSVPSNFTEPMRNLVLPWKSE